MLLPVVLVARLADQHEHGGLRHDQVLAALERYLDGRATEEDREVAYSRLYGQITRLAGADLPRLFTQLRGAEIGVPGPVATMVPDCTACASTADAGRYSPTRLRSSPSSGAIRRRSPTTINRLLVTLILL
jgi:hypothetical protein